MTTICFRNGILAADTRAYSGGKAPIGQKTKIFHNAELKLACGCSTTAVGFGERFWMWLTGAIGDKDFKDSQPEDAFTALTIQDGEVFIYENSPFPTGPLTADYFAIGSGRDIALGAMEMGASAPEAVRVACKHDVWTAEPIMAIDLRGKEERSLGAKIEEALRSLSGY